MSIESWWSSIPPVTQKLFAGCGITTIIANLGFVSPAKLVFLPHLVFYKFEIWRLVTSFLFLGKLGFPFLISLTMIYQYSSSLEREKFGGRKADFVYMLFLSCSALLIIGWGLNYVILGRSLIFVLVYLWSRSNPNAIVSFFFGLRFQAVYLPWVLVGFHFLLNGSIPWQEIVGIFVGHLYYFLTDHLPLRMRIQPLKTPQFFVRLFSPAPIQNQPVWGRGYALGRQ
eukprot:TRINITY_DN379_c2_g2_i1.p1 TRINITY_DN379_c2_g2~~TRINITY_DN379_c2_g2_i1.p1  ORF type:complete len:227 (-),score=81.49 TRINITY_DN379_c2_g2_i1:35-715(-)